jgi:hypothetical protein
MPTISLHTRLTAVLLEATSARSRATDFIGTAAANSISANAVVELAQDFAAALARIAPYEGDESLADYADAQFPEFGEGFQLLERIAGLKVLVQGVIAQCRASVPRDGNDYVLKDVWAADGTVSVRALSPAQTAGVRAALQAVLDNIPE